MSTQIPGDEGAGASSQKRPPSAWPLWAMPLAIFGGFGLAVAYAPQSIEDLYLDKLLPFLISTWVGMGFAFTWDMLSFSMAGVPKSVALITTVLSIFILLNLAGGVQIIWEDPWFLGVAIFPGIRLAMRYARRS
ncbi:MAG: hypothetical protein GEU75_07190 [Dehalococcoidia bacterium]|nr:hypothetical protein [Dehalococcoidia bacterium]